MEIMQLPPRADRRKLIATRDVYFSLLHRNHLSIARIFI